MKEKEKGLAALCRPASLNPQLLLPLGPSSYKIFILETELSRIYCPETYILFSTANFLYCTSKFCSHVSHKVRFFPLKKCMCVYIIVSCFLIYGVFPSLALVKNNQEILSDLLHSRDYYMHRFCYILSCTYSFHNN